MSTTSPRRRPGSEEVESLIEAINEAADGTHRFPEYERISEMQIAADFIEKLHSLKYALEADLLACDAKWTLFVAAALSYRYDTQLKPVPQKFMSEQSGCNIDALISIINDTPKLRIVLQHILEQNYDEFDTDVVDLLHWVLVEMHDTMLRSVDEEEFHSILSTLMQQQKEALKPTHVFEVCPSAESRSENTFRTLAKELHSNMAFYGDKLESYYSILHLGFPQLMQNGQGDDEVNLCSELSAVVERSPNGAGWGASSCGSMISCVALCEYINHAEFINTRQDSQITHVQVNNREMVRVRYLLFYGSRFPDDNNPKSVMLSWISRNKYALSLVCYTLLLTSIGLANSGSGHYIKHLLSKKAAYFLEFCKRIFVTD